MEQLCADGKWHKFDPVKEAERLSLTEIIAKMLARLNELEIVVAGNDRTFHEIIEDNTRLATRLEAHNEWLKISDQQRLALTKRVAAIERVHARPSDKRKKEESDGREKI